MADCRSSVIWLAAPLKPPPRVDRTLRDVAWLGKASEVPGAVQQPQGDVAVQPLRGQGRRLARVEVELVVVGVAGGIDRAEHAGAVGVRGRAQAGEGARSGRRPMPIELLVSVACLYGGVEDRLQRVVAGRPAGAADDQRVGARRRDRGGLDHDRLAPRRAPSALPIVLPLGSSTVIVPIRLGSVVRTSERV